MCCKASEATRTHDNLKKIGKDLFNDYSSKAFKAGLTIKKKFQESVDSSASPEKRILLDESVSCSCDHRTVLLRHSHLLPRKPLVLSLNRPVILERSDGEDRGKTVVEVKIQWPCKN